jgi:hypothetical protein
MLWQMPTAPGRVGVRTKIIGLSTPIDPAFLTGIFSDLQRDVAVSMCDLVVL